MAGKRDVVGQLTRPELQAIADRYGLEVDDRRAREQLIDAAVRARRVSLDEVLAELSRDRLKELCAALGLDESGREKALLVARLTGATYEPSQPDVVRAEQVASRYAARSSPNGALEAAIEDTDGGAERIVELHGGMSDARREEVQAAFNSPPGEHPARILLATDTAREGVNLQGHCADLFHYDVPWNPARMEQRNGRIDRALQKAPEVRCHYFVLADRREDHVLATLVSKVKTIQEELGSLGEVVLARLGDALRDGIGEHTVENLARAEKLSDRRKQATATLEEQRARAKIEAEIEDAGGIYDRSRRTLVGFSPEMLREVVDVALEDVGEKGSSPRWWPDGRRSCCPRSTRAGSERWTRCGRRGRATRRPGSGASERPNRWCSNPSTR